MFGCYTVDMYTLKVLSILNMVPEQLRVQQQRTGTKGRSRSAPKRKALVKKAQDR
jgi:hypothetical protein